MLFRSRRGLAVASFSYFTLFSTAAFAEPFSWQVSGGVMRPDERGAQDERTSVNATYYFEPIDDANGPLALAAFLDPTSQMFVTADRAERPALFNTIDSYGLIGVHERAVDSYRVGGRYVLPESRWYAGGALRTSYAKQPPTASSSRPGDTNTSTLAAGKYFGERTSLTLVLDRSLQTTVTPLGCSILSRFCGSQAVIVDTETRSASLEALHLWQGRSVAYVLSGAVSQSAAEIDVAIVPPPRLVTPAPPSFAGGVAVAPGVFAGRVNVFRLAGEVFPSERLGVRLSHERADPNVLVPSDGRSELAISWYFRPRIGVQFSYSNDDYGSGFDYQGRGIQLTGRF